MTKHPPSFLAILRYAKTEEGGRKTPAASGIRPHIKFPFDSYLTSGQQEFLDCEIVNPGETVSAKVTILAREHFARRLYTGAELDFGEGSRKTGSGIIIEVLDDMLKAVSP